MKQILQFFSLMVCTTAIATLARGQILIQDDFEGYNNAAPLAAQSSHWGTWSGCTPCSEDAVVSTVRAFSGTKSMEIFGQGGPQDVLLLLGDSTTGRYRLSFKLYVEANNNAYFNHQKCQNNPGGCWGQEITLQAAGTGDLDAGGASVAQYQYRQGRWIDVIQYWDLDNSWTTLVIDTTVVYSWDASVSSQGTGAQLLQIGAFDFYATSAGPHWFFVDDVVFEKLPDLPSKGSVARLHLDMREFALTGGTIDNPHVAGNFNGWSTTANAMTDNGDSTFYAFVQIENETQAQFKFLSGNAWGTDESVPMACGVDNGQGGYNRFFDVDTLDLNVAPICFSKCVACDLNVSTTPVWLDDQWRIYPNPISEILFLEFGFERSADVTVRLYNLTGQALVTQQLGSVEQGRFSISVENLTAGFYFLNLTVDGHSITKKVVIE